MKPQAAVLRSRSIGHGDALPQTKPNKTLILVHGRGFKPARTELETLWLRALRAGLQRDAPDAAAALDRCTVRLVYYGDEIHDVLAARGRRYDPALDLADLNNTVGTLAALSKTKQFRREHYERLPGKTPLKEFLADIGAPALSVLGLKERALERFMPELADYWRADRSTLSTRAFAALLAKRSSGVTTSPSSRTAWAASSPTTPCCRCPATSRRSQRTTRSRSG
jgi:hypothetical protein